MGVYNIINLRSEGLLYLASLNGYYGNMVAMVTSH